MNSITQSNISSSANQWIFESSAFPLNLVNAVKAILEDVAEKIEEVRVMAHNKCPWALYLSKSGHRCAQFIARRKFSGLHLSLLLDGAIITDLATGEQYSATPHSCTCDDFINWHCATGDKCEHIIKLEEHTAELVPAEAEALPPAPAAPQERVEIDLNDLPASCEAIEATGWDGSAHRQYWVFAADESRNTRSKRDIGRISEWRTGTDILAYVPDQIAGGRKFSTTFDAVAFLMYRCGLQPCRRWTGEFIEPEEKVSPDRDEDLDYHLSPGDRLPPRRAWSEGSEYMDDDGCIPW
ncbi:hypothetical protein [Kamptonema formosum]|uniref:hypothetical protein n=1 Tax=Kamptonema formosum TaxID=331992 RepID=UPI000345956C|nr:hypothetical protein [Oscillatoria sp. PCC 10802]